MFNLCLLIMILVGPCSSSFYFSVFLLLSVFCVLGALCCRCLWLSIFAPFGFPNDY